MANIRHNLKNLLLKGKSFVSVINSSKENILNGNLDKRGWESVSVNGGGDSPAATFLSAAGITDPTITSAVYTLVNDLNGYGLWSKMKAIYPMVGGNATAHSYNLKDTTKFQITWNGGLTHSSNGVLGNGTNGYGNTFLNSFNEIKSAGHLSFYSRTQTISSNQVDIGSGYNGGTSACIIYNTSNICQGYYGSGSYYTEQNINDKRGYIISSKINSTSLKLYNNGILVSSNIQSNTMDAPNYYMSIFAYNLDGTNILFSTKQCAFATIGDGLSDTESANLYTSIQKFQTTLNRFVGTPIYSSFDSDAQSFMTSASITDSTQQAAVNYLVTDLKSNNLWTKMKAVYPMVGGTATSHSYNLKNPSQFQITWNGGLTHDSNGVTGNGTNGYGNLNLNPRANLTTQYSFGTYCRVNNGNANQFDFGSTDQDGFNNYCTISQFASLQYNHFVPANGISISNTTTNAFFHVGLDTSNNLFSFKNTTLLKSQTPASIGTAPSKNTYLFGYNNNGTAMLFSARPSSLFFICENITQAENTTIYNIIQNYQTILSRNI